jgi:lipopolysaccharide export LptBFGC system permease protein LptF
VEPARHAAIDLSLVDARLERLESQLGESDILGRTIEERLESLEEQQQESETQVRRAQGWQRDLAVLVAGLYGIALAPLFARIVKEPIFYAVLAFGLLVLAVLGERAGWKGMLARVAVIWIACGVAAVCCWLWIMSR